MTEPTQISLFAIKTAIRKNLLMVVLSTLILSLILNLHLLNFSGLTDPLSSTSEETGLSSFIDVKISSSKNKPLPESDISNDVESNQKGTFDTIKNKFKESFKQTSSEKEEDSLLVKFHKEYNISDFEITKQNELRIPSAYQNLLNTYPLEYLISLSPQEKCTKYFETLFETSTKPIFLELQQQQQQLQDSQQGQHKSKSTVSNGWKLSKFNGLPYTPAAYEKYQAIFKETEETKQEDNERYGTEVIMNQRLERLQLDALRHYKAFDTCFLSNSATTDSSAVKTEFNITDIERRLFPWMSFKLPQYRRWDNTTINGQFPLMSQFISGQSAPELQPQKVATSDSFLANMKNSLNGKGYMVSASNKHASQAYQLIALLRALGNRLPIQIFHYGDLSKYHQNRLIHIARATKGLKLEGAIDNLRYIMKEKGIHSIDDEAEVEKLFPVQELWFVNAKGTLDPNHREEFDKFGNKLIAYFFSSFKYSILIDTDTIPLVDLDYNLIQSEEFEARGAYFFKDRELSDKFPHGDVVVDYFKRFLPGKLDSFFLNMTPLTNHTTDINFFKHHAFHYMESGVVLVDKYRHFLPVLTTMLINQIDQIKGIVYGDKELFWLGFALSGTESYYMNKWPAGAISSEITPLTNRIYHDDQEEKFINEACSTHPAHLSGIDDKTVLWINSGFVRCKNFEDVNDSHLDSRLNPKKFDSVFEMKLFYSTYQTFEHLLIPGATDYQGSGSYFGNWWKMDECSGYIWCAYNNQTNPSSTDTVLGNLFDVHFNATLSSSNTNEIINYEDKKAQICPQRNERELKEGILLNFEKGQKLYFNYLGSIYDGVLKIYNLQYA